MTLIKLHSQSFLTETATSQWHQFKEKLILLTK